MDCREGRASCIAAWSAPRVTASTALPTHPTRARPQGQSQPCSETLDGTLHSARGHSKEQSQQTHKMTKTTWPSIYPVGTQGPRTCCPAHARERPESHGTDLGLAHTPRAAGRSQTRGLWIMRTDCVLWGQLVTKARPSLAPVGTASFPTVSSENKTVWTVVHSHRQGVHFAGRHRDLPDSFYWETEPES